MNKQSSKGRNKVTDDMDSKSTTDDIAPVAKATKIQYKSTIKHLKGKMDDNDDDESDAIITIGLSLPSSIDIKEILPNTGISKKYPNPLPSCSVSGCQGVKKYNVVQDVDGDRLFACSLDHFKQLKSSNIR